MENTNTLKNRVNDFPSYSSNLTFLEIVLHVGFPNGHQY